MVLCFLHRLNVIVGVLPIKDLPPGAGDNFTIFFYKNFWGNIGEILLF